MVVKEKKTGFPSRYCMTMKSLCTSSVRLGWHGNKKWVRALRKKLNEALFIDKNKNILFFYYKNISFTFVSEKKKANVLPSISERKLSCISPTLTLCNPLILACLVFVWRTESPQHDCYPNVIISFVKEAEHKNVFKEPLTTAHHIT